MILWSVYVLVTLALGKHWAIDRFADSKGKLQLTIFPFAVEATPPADSEFAHYASMYRAALNSNSPVYPKLMRHSDSHMTIKYGGALDSSKRDTNTKVVELIMKPSKRRTGAKG